MAKPVENEEHEEESAEFVDPQTVLREKCRQEPGCAKLVKRLEECNERVRGRVKTSETCHEEVIDMFHCVDHCVAKDLFHHLK